MFYDRDADSGVPADHDEPDRARRSPGDAEDDEPTEGLDYCELCGATQDGDDELLRCEECGRLHCSNCRAHDADGTPYCVECYDDLVEE
jgi:hypothetical protein